MCFFIMRTIIILKKYTTIDSVFRGKLVMKICYTKMVNLFQKINIVFFDNNAFTDNLYEITKKTLYIFMKARYNIKCK